MNKIFDLQRFGNLAKWDILTNKKFYIRIVIGLTIALAFIFCFNTWIDWTQGSSRIASGYHLDSLAGMSIFIATVVMYVAATYIFNNMQTKEMRIEFLMQPASNFEKYMVRFLSMTVGVFLLASASIVVADLIHQLFCVVAGYDLRGSVTMHILNNVNSEDARPGIFVMKGMEQNIGVATMEYAALLFLLINHAFYTFCGSLFRRNVWLLAICSHFILGFTIVICIFKLIDMGVFNVIFANETSISITINTMLLVGTVITGLLYYASYKIFTRMQVINNKWLNL